MVFPAPDIEPDRFSMEWEFNRGVQWEDSAGQLWDAKDLFYEVS